MEVSSRLCKVQGRQAILAIARDITERRRTENAYRSAIEVAEAANRYKSELIANISHEFRTALNSILGYAELLLDEMEGPIGAGQRDCLQRLQRNATELQELVDDLLDLSIATSGRSEPCAVAFDLEALLDDAVSSFSQNAERKGISLKLRSAPGLPRRLVGDPKRLRQVLGCLLDNALKFTDEGGIEVSVDEEGRGGKEVRFHFTVRDTGMGIPETRTEEIFRPFVQVNGSSTRRFGGAGLGLAIARHSVTLMGGRIWMESEEGQGSTFHFTARFEDPECEIGPSRS